MAIPTSRTIIQNKMFNVYKENLPSKMSGQQIVNKCPNALLEFWHIKKVKGKPKCKIHQKSFVYCDQS